MKTISGNHELRQEVLEGELREEIFRPGLTDIHLNNAEAEVQDDPA